MGKLSERDRGRIIELLEKGEGLPLDYKHILFPPEKKEYELVYASKEREEDILADTMAVPLQAVRTFGRNGADWHNMLIFGDNLQAMKTLLEMKKAGKLCNSDGTSGIRLIYIDPPFASKQDFRGTEDQKAYQDKIAGADFLEYLRKRLVLMRELLSDDGSVYVHLDYRKMHYVKVLGDEVFKENNFLNEVIWCYRERGISRTFWNNKHQTLLVWVARKGQHYFNCEASRIPYSEEYLKKFKYKDENGRYQIRGKNIQGSPVQRADGLTPDAEKKYPGLTYRQYLTDGQLPLDWWELPLLNKAANERLGYPTQKPESLLEKVFRVSSKKGDLVLDAFAGSGTTCAVAEKLGRRWIGIDCGKLAIYTMQKRMLNLKSEIGNKGKPLKPKPFTLYHAGLYDFSQLKQLPWKDWRLFALHLFNCRDEKHTVSGIELDGYKGRSDVLVFDYQKDGGVVLDYGFIDDLHSMIGAKAGRQFFIIAPAASVMFLEDYIDKGSVRYYILRIPYSIINELHNRDFEAIKQPIDESQVNDTVDAVGFDFIRPPKVECAYSIEKPKVQLLECAMIKINTFKNEAMIKGASQLPNRESLSMIMVDLSYDSDVFNLDKVYYASEIEKNGWKVFLPVDEIKEQIMIIYLDIYGNEYREIKALQDFSGSKQDQKGGK